MDNVNLNIGLDSAFVFAPVYRILNRLVGAHKVDWVQVKEDSTTITRIVAPIANVAKKALIYLAMAVGTVVAGLFSLFALPIRIPLRNIAFQQSCKIDLARLSPSEYKAIHAEVSKYLNEHGKDLTPNQRKEYMYKIMVSYARSNKIYGPIVRAWTEYLLDKANKENKQLVFMARDGIPPYKMALKLMATPEYQLKYPNLVGDKKIVLGYLSRKSIAFSTNSPANQKLFQEYAENELGIKKGAQCLFVDIGFAGSMIDKIKGLLPHAKINFEYCMSLTEKANGFLTHNHKLNSLYSAWANPGMHWLEDAHQGTGASPRGFVRIGTRVYPDTVQPHKKLYHEGIEVNSLEYMLRKFSQRAAVRCYKDKPLNAKDLSAAVTTFDDVIQKINNSTVPWFIHHK